VRSASSGRIRRWAKAEHSGLRGAHSGSATGQPRDAEELGDVAEDFGADLERLGHPRIIAASHRYGALRKTDTFR
jgi:hypothetical protein